MTKFSLNQLSSAISDLLISTKLLLEIISIMLSKLSPKICINFLLGTLPVFTVISFGGNAFNRKESKKSLSLLITILFSSIAF